MSRRYGLEVGLAVPQIFHGEGRAIHSFQGDESRRPQQVWFNPTADCY
jgi:hypothetical protein